MDNPIQSASEPFGGYAVREETWTIAGRQFHLTWPADMDALLDLPATRERFKRDAYMPYWATPWPGSVLLAERVLRGPRGEGRPAIEIGCGVGLVSLAAASGGWAVTATDYDPDAVAFTGHNAKRNGIALAGAAVLDFRQPLEAARYLLILGSDVLYEKRLAEPVARWIASALLADGEAWISDPNRSAAEGFAASAGDAGLSVESEPAETTAPAGLLTRGRVWRVRWRT